MNSREDVVQMKPVQIGDISMNIEDDILKFDLPGYGQCKYSIEMVDYYGGGTALSGNQVGGSGYFIYVDMPEGRGGYFSINNRDFALFPAKNGRAVIIESDIVGNTNDCGSGNTSLNSPSSSPSTAPPTTHECDNPIDDCAAVVKIVVLVTPEATAFYSGLGNPFAVTLFSYISMYAINGAFIRSGIVNKEVAIETVPYTFTAYPVPIPPGTTRDSNTDLGLLSSDPIANGLRISNNGDIVIMLSPAVYAGLAGTVGSNIGPCQGCQWGIVEAPALFGNRHTFAHEVGHLLGARHNSVDNANSQSGDNEGYCEHGLEFTAEGNSQFTMMAVNPDTGGRLLNFSNPSVLVLGTPTGTTSPDDSQVIANNALFLSHTTCVVAGYFDDEISVMIDGQSCIAPEDLTPYTPIVIPPSSSSLPGQPPYAYEWKWSPLSVGSYFPFDPPETGASLIINDQLFTFPFFWLQLEVTSSDGLVTYAHKKVYVEPCIGFDGGKLTEREATDSDSNIEFKKGDNKLRVYPNPSTGVINFDFTKKNRVIESVSIANSYGVTIYNKAYNAEESTVLYLDGIDKGLYFIKVVADKETFTSKFIIH